MTREACNKAALNIIADGDELIDDIKRLSDANYSKTVEVAQLEATTMAVICEEPSMENPTKPRYSNETARKAALIDMLSNSGIYNTLKKAINENEVNIKIRTLRLNLTMKYLDFVTSFVHNLPA